MLRDIYYSLFCVVTFILAKYMFQNFNIFFHDVLEYLTVLYLIRFLDHVIRFFIFNSETHVVKFIVLCIITTYVTGYIVVMFTTDGVFIKVLQCVTFIYFMRSVLAIVIIILEKYNIYIINDEP